MGTLNRGKVVLHQICLSGTHGKMSGPFIQPVTFSENYSISGIGPNLAE